MKKVYIDGSAGTTGLRINERFENRDDIELISIPKEHRKDNEWRARYLNEADIAFLCLPDDAAREAVSKAGIAPASRASIKASRRTGFLWGEQVLQKEQVEI